MSRTSRQRRALAKHIGPVGLLTAVCAGAIGMIGAGCSGDGTDGPCVSTEQYFAENVWAPILSQKCIPCHNPQGLAKDSKMVLRGASEAGYLSTNLEIVKNVASFEQNDTSLLLLKPSGQISHTGGKLAPEGSEDYKALESLVQRFKEPEECETNVAAFYAGVQFSTPGETLRKASIALAGRLPTEAEEASVTEGGEEALVDAIYALTTEEQFYVRLKEIYNDLFLTDRYARNSDALGLLSDEEYYRPFWYDTATGTDQIKYYGAQSSGDLREKLRTWTNVGVAREPLELIAHVVREGRPFTEILTANYMMVNPFSAKAYSITDVTFQNDADPNEYVEGRITDFPHAGVLTSAMFLNRFPTTDTNRNRHRSRMVYNFFLGTDILKTAEQPIDPTKITDINPTLNNVECTVCHANIDPIAGAFHNFDAQGRYTPEPHYPDNEDAPPWYSEMRLPGFGGEPIPSEELPNALGWLAPRLGADPRFPLAVVYTMYTGLTGLKPLLAPPDPNAADYKPAFKAYLAQYATFDKIAKTFVASGHDLRVVVSGIVTSPYFRAKNAMGLSPERLAEVKDLGTARFMIPEQMNRKLKAVLGYPWRWEVDDGDLLLSTNQYRILYGGTDSDSVTQRVVEPNGIMANIADRMANEMSCWTVARDFFLPQDERILFPLVDTTFQPKDDNGFTIEPSIKGIKENIVYLHRRILGEHLSIDDPEVERTYQVFLGTWEEGKAGMKLEGDAAYPTWLPWSCQVRNDYWTGKEYSEEEALQADENYVIRSWMSVVTYLLTDYAFIYE
jgi:hypothetical protein